MTKYICHAFHEHLPNGRASGLLEVREGTLTWLVGDKSMTISMADVAVSMGGANNRLIFFEHPLYPKWQFYVSDRSILKDSQLLRQDNIATVFRSIKHHRARGWALIAIVVLCVIFTPLLLLFRMDIFTAIIAQKIPVSWESSLGESALAQFELGKSAISDEDVDDLLRPLTDPLHEALADSRYTYHYHIVDDVSVNAFALPGGDIVIHSALILKADSAEELLGVLAHEIMHVEYQHGVRNVLGSAGIVMTVGALFGDVGGIMAVLASAAPLLLNQNYSRRFEKESDIEGFELLLRAKIDPSGLQQFFVKLKLLEEERLQKMNGEQTKDIVKNAMTYLSTHPATETRIAHLNQLLVERQHQIEANMINLDAEFRTLQNAVSAFSQRSETEVGGKNEK